MTEIKLDDLHPAAKSRLLTGMVLKLSTGYFGRPGHDGGKVHIVSHTPGAGPIPLCGTPLPKDSEYQWCAWGIERRFLRNECKRCERALARLDERLASQQ